MARNTTALYDKIFFARQPILKEDSSIWGYELLFRNSSAATKADITDDYKATLNVAANSCAIPGQPVQPGVKLVINFSHKSILEKIPYALPSQNTVVQISETIPPTPNLLAALQELSNDGYYIAINDYEVRPQGEILIDYADAVFVDVLTANTESLKRAHKSCEGKKVQLIAKRVEDSEKYELAKRVGFKLFQGYFFKKPENIGNRRLNSNEIARLKLYRLIENDMPDFDDLAEAIQADVSLTYRLLTLLNSPIFGFSQKIKSVKQAIVLAGWKLLKNWLRVIILTDLTPPQKSSELPLNSAQRAKFLELTARAYNNRNIDPETMFLLGLFSLLEPMFDLPMASVIKYLPLDQEIQSALCGERNIYTDWLDMAILFETAQWDVLERHLGELGFDPLIVSRCYYLSMRWANAFFHNPAEAS
ncbi:EAL and HDOD domain-containing protein [Maridesulfovibrio bastinii]|uniref:EAL and HDOD domain-containing protein n=1 Tax=Maridesulfovibrio bastinii TaxID=47157 RepID=UPI000410C355|nr:HDOD domain-containing protein [Maridesulfovibrio bastinii]